MKNNQKRITKRRELEKFKNPHKYMDQLTKFITFYFNIFEGNYKISRARRRVYV